jgi:hypothetical protein
LHYEVSDMQRTGWRNISSERAAVSEDAHQNSGV